MIVLVNGGPALDRFGKSPYLGRLVSPRCGNLVRPGERWAADNDAFLAWDEGRFLAMLERFIGVPDCLFVASPDVVGDSAATLARFTEWEPKIRTLGFPVALVGQDGVEHIDIPWAKFEAFFIGGSTEWKLSRDAASLVAEAKVKSKWVHMGRVNTRVRMQYAFDIGCDSIDGTGWSKFPDVYLKKHLSFFPIMHSQLSIFARPEPSS